MREVKYIESCSVGVFKVRSDGTCLLIKGLPLYHNNERLDEKEKSIPWTTALCKYVE